MLESLHLVDFRCHARKDLRGIGPRPVWVAPNGAGKSSILEAVCFLSRVKSFRTGQSRELVAWGARSCGVSGRVLSDDGSAELLKIEWSAEKRTLTRGANEGVSFREYWGGLPTVVLQNDDRQLVRGGGQMRRQWADTLMSWLYPGYLARVQRAGALLREKNALLRNPAVDVALWGPLTEQLREQTAAIHEARSTFTTEAGPLLEVHYGELAGRPGRTDFTRKSDIPRLLETADADLRRREQETGAALLGPQRDDWVCACDGVDLRTYGSEGQQKALALTMRLLEVFLVEKHTGRRPLLLVDDALNELDAARQGLFWEKLPRATPVWYATTRDELVPDGQGFEKQALLAMPPTDG